MKTKLFTRTKPVTAFNAYLGHGVIPEPEQTEKLEPAVGYKKVFLRVNDLNKVELVAPTFEKVIPLISRAECHSQKGAEDHLKKSNGKMSIGRNCTCGYYSFREAEDAFKYTGKWVLNSVAEVVNSGYYVEHEEGYRAERIRVTRILTQYCSKCAPEHKNPAVTFNKSDQGYLMPLCGDHNNLWAYHEWQADKIVANFMRPADMTADFVIESVLPGVSLNITPQVSQDAQAEPSGQKGFWSRIFA